MRTIGLVCVAVVGCAVDGVDDVDMPDQETLVAARESVSDPCLTESPDRSTTTLGSISASNLNFAFNGQCTSFIAQYASLAYGRDIYTQVRWSTTAGITEAQCAKLHSTERVYKKTGLFGSWVYVGETTRWGAWNANRCDQALVSNSTPVVAEDAVYVRVIASVNSSTAIFLPTAIFDNDPFPEVAPPPDDVGFPDDPCLSEGADGTFAPQVPYVGTVVPSSTSPDAYGVCDWYIADWTKTSTFIEHTPDLSTKVKYTGTPTATTCASLQIRERVYSRNGSATAWKYEGESVRMGVWQDNTCKQRLDDASSQVLVPGGYGVRRIRVLASVYLGPESGRANLYLDDAELPED